MVAEASDHVDQLKEVDHHDHVGVADTAMMVAVLLCAVALLPVAMMVAVHHCPSVPMFVQSVERSVCRIGSRMDEWELDHGHHLHLLHRHQVHLCLVHLVPVARW